MSQRVVDLLADALGAFRAGLPVVLSGPAGSGQTVTALQIAADALARGERVVYLTQEPPGLLLSQSTSLALDLERQIRSRQFTFLEMSSDVASLVRLHGGAALTAALLEENPGASLIAIDPVTALAAELADEVQLRVLVQGLFRAATDAGCTVLATAPTESLRPALEQVLVSLCGAWVQLERDEAGPRRLRLRKSRAGSLGVASVPFEIGAGGAMVLARDTLPSEEGDSPGPPGPGNAAPARQESQSGHASPGSGTPRAGISPSDGNRPKILIVEDDRLNREQLVEVLGRDYEVVTAGDGFEAVSVLLSERPDLIVLDLVLPKVSGYEVLCSLQNSGARIPVLVVSGFLLRAVDRVRALVLGATDTLAKPVQPLELLHKIQTLLLLPRSPQHPDADRELAESLFRPGTSRLLEDAAFRLRLERSCRFGEMIGSESSLLAIESSSAPSLEALIDVVEEMLRIEDAALRTGEERVLALLVATDPATVPKVLTRLEAGLRAAGRSSATFRWRAHRAGAVSEDDDWGRFFKDLQPWPQEEGR